MNSYPLAKSENFMESRPTSLAGGSKTLDFEMNSVNQQPKPSKRSMSLDAPAVSQEHFSTCGIEEKLRNYSTECSTQEFTVRSNGSIGQEILGPDGHVIAWTTDPLIAQVICKLLNRTQTISAFDEVKEQQNKPALIVQNGLRHPS